LVVTPKKAFLAAIALPKTALGGQFCPAGGRCRAFTVSGPLLHLLAENFGKIEPYPMMGKSPVSWHKTCVATGAVLRQLSLLRKGE
jgi:hypothetical protein